MIIRTCDARPHPGQLAELCDFPVEATRDFPQRYDGFLGAEILVAEHDDVLMWVSRWRDEAALESYAGPTWREQPVILPAEERLLAEPLKVRHFTPFDAE